MRKCRRLTLLTDSHRFGLLYALFPRFRRGQFAGLWNSCPESYELNYKLSTSNLQSSNIITIADKYVNSPPLPGIPEGIFCYSGNPGIALLNMSR